MNKEDNILIDSIWVFTCLYDLSNLEGYDLEKNEQWVSEQKKFYNRNRWY